MDTDTAQGFPNALVAAAICRPELLCEAEALAVLPRPRPVPKLGRTETSMIPGR
jgi:hypothetical protein